MTTTKIQLIEGVYTSNIQTLEWECPISMTTRSAWGEFYYDGEYYTHDVYINDILVYTVIAK